VVEAETERAQRCACEERAFARPRRCPEPGHPSAPSTRHLTALRSTPDGSPHYGLSLRLRRASRGSHPDECSKGGPKGESR
jgi:hypothetical protein